MPLLYKDNGVWQTISAAGGFDTIAASRSLGSGRLDLTIPNGKSLSDYRWLLSTVGNGVSRFLETQRIPVDKIHERTGGFNLYGVHVDGTGVAVYNINPITGALTERFPRNSAIRQGGGRGGSAIVQGTTIYLLLQTGTNTVTLYSISLVDGAVVNRGNVQGGVPSGSWIGVGLTERAGQVYAAIEAGFNRTYRLWRLTPPSNASTQVTSTAYGTSGSGMPLELDSSLSGLELYTHASGTVYRYTLDLTTGAPTLLDSRSVAGTPTVASLSTAKLNAETYVYVANRLFRYGAGEALVDVSGADDGLSTFNMYMASDDAGGEYTIVSDYYVMQRAPGSNTVLEISRLQTDVYIHDLIGVR